MSNREQNLSKLRKKSPKNREIHLFRSSNSNINKSERSKSKIMSKIHQDKTKRMSMNMEKMMSMMKKRINEKSVN